MFFYVENRIFMVIVLGVILSCVGFLGSFLINCIVLNFGIMIGVIIVGILSGKFLVDGFEIVCENVFNVRIYVFIKKDIKYSLKREYFEIIKNIIKVFLEMDVENEII